MILQYNMKKQLLEDFELMKSMGLTIRSHNVSMKNGKKCQIYYDKIYDKNKNPIKYESKFNNTHNALHVFTGELHGGYIGIDIDCKNNKLSNIIFCLKTLNELPCTLKCTTPNGGFHYLFKLNNKQKKVLVDYKSRQPELFGCDIDVLYNTGRFVMSGEYPLGYNNWNAFYRIIDSSEPAFLPDIIFNEIVKCSNLNKSKSTIPTELSSSENSSKSVNKYNINKILKSYLDCLKPERCDKRESWLRIGIVIFNEKGSFELFNNWSKLSQKYDSDGCVELWKSLDVNRERKLTIGTLKKYAKEDDPVQYRKIQQRTKIKKPFDEDIKKATKILDEIYRGYINDKLIADLIFCLYPNKFIYDKKNKYWYTLNKYNIYEEEDKTLFTVRELINTHILNIIKNDCCDRVNECEEKIHDIGKSIKQCNNDTKMLKLENILECLEKKLESIKNTEYKLIQFICTETKKDSIIRALATLCRKRNIYEKLDTINPYLFAFKNGVYDLKNKTFRLPTAEEYICCTCKYKYGTPKQKYVDQLENMFADVFPDPIERKYVLMLLAASLLGTNLFEIFVVFIGSGSNGKGLIMQLLDSTLGGYFGTLDIDYFNSKDNVKSGSANSSLAACKNSRWVNVSEVESNIKLKDNRLKQLSGRDKILARNLYGNSFEYIAKFILCFQTNEKPIIDGADEAIKRRLRYITFRSKFVDNPTLPNEKKIDRSLKDRILINDQYKYAFFAILLKYYFILSDNENMNLNIPASFQIEIDNYLNENDPVASFIKDCLGKSNNSNDSIQSSDLYNEFKIYSNDKYVPITKFKTILEKNDLKSIRGKSGSVYHNLIFKNRPSLQNKKLEVEFIDD